MISKRMVNNKRHQVRMAYAEHGVHSSQYQDSFDELHEMNMKFMAQQYRRHRGLSKQSKTPYC